MINICWSHTLYHFLQFYKILSAVKLTLDPVFVLKSVVINVLACLIDTHKHHITSLNVLKADGFELLCSSDVSVWFSGMSACFQVSGPSSVRCVTKRSTRRALCRCTESNTRARSPTDAKCALLASLKRATWSCTWRDLMVICRPAANWWVRVERLQVIRLCSVFKGFLRSRETVSVESHSVCAYIFD